MGTLADMARRPWGSGSIYQRKDGRWIGSVETHDGQGIRSRRYATGKTRADVERKLRELPNSSHPEAVRLSDYLDTWLRDVVRPRVRERTLQGYAVIVERHIAPHLGGHRLDRLAPGHVRRWLNDLDVAPRTKVHALTVLRAALSQAVADRLIDRSPAAKGLVSTPDVPHDPIRPLDADQARAFLASVADDPLAPLYELALGTGMRQGEMLALRWQDIADHRLTVNRSLTRLGARFLHERPKTPQSRRTIPLSPRVVAALKRQREYVGRMRREAKVWAEQDLVFCDAQGGPLPNWWVTREFQARIAEAKLPRQRFHDLRHGAASLMIEAGADLATVREILGHSTITTTVNIYGHLTERHKRAAIDRLAEALG